MTLIREPYFPPQQVKITVTATPVAELLVAMWASTAEADSLDSFENSATIEAIRQAADIPADDWEWMSEASAARWSFLLQFVIPNDIQSVSDLADLIAEQDPNELMGLLTHSDDDEDCDPDVCAHKHIESTNPTADRDRIVSILRSLPPELDIELKELASSLEHDEHLSRFLARSLDPEQLIETVTKGVAFRLNSDTTEVVLIPSVVVRPWNLMFGFGGTRYFVYPISDEAVDADPDSPPSWMIEMFKSLGDERRLRLLRRLGESPAGLGELAEYLDLAKSTTHHHLRLLRAAGLVKAVITGSGKDGTHYELRPKALEDAAQFVASYLRTGPFEGDTT
ncbi:MAG: helix-turn-helix transcriptional regulator [Acidimicrobiia bacterium]|nr:helix-turn-helix transcriptional regulator [Acidimicrobiia bacterium]